MKQYLVKNEKGEVVADIKVNDNANLKLEEVKNNSVIVDSLFIRIHLEPRTAGAFKNKAIYLSEKFNWELKKDNSGSIGGCMILIPTNK